jgi:Domain of unknown function (DUF4326)
MSDRPTRIRLSRAKGWRMPENTVKVDRTTKWGNPFDFRHSSHCWSALAFGCRADPAGRQEASVVAFREWIGGAITGVEAKFGAVVDDRFEAFATSPAITPTAAPSHDDIRRELRGKNLACWCRVGAPCHADVLLELANAAVPA